MANTYAGIRASKFRRVRDGKTLIDGMPVVPTLGDIWWVDGTNGAASNTGKAPNDAFALLATALTKVDQHDIVYVMAKEMAASDTDPGNYAETVTISVPQISVIGVGRGPVQGGLPQFKIGAGSTVMISVEAPGVTLENLGINGASSTGGGIKLRADGSTMDANGAIIRGCHFKNCKGSSSTNAATGGAVMLSGAPWQVLIEGNRFYKNVADVVLLDTNNSVPQDVVIQDNEFSDSGATTDCNVYLAGGSGPGIGLTIARNIFGIQPAVSSGSNAVFAVLTGADGGMYCGNFFGTDGTHGATGNAAKIPTTVFIAGNYDEGGLVART